MWTLPEIVLSKGDTVTVYGCGQRDRPDLPLVEFGEIPKALFPSRAWGDPLTSRQLIEHYSNLHLSRLELVKIALECLMSRRFKALHPGDRVYVLMGLLRIRPPIDKTDSSFQAFARLSLPQDSDRLMERLICLLPEAPDQNWELMTDQYKASLWDIYPETQVCGIGENDTVVVDNAKGAQIQWSGFTEVRLLRNLTTKRMIFLYLVVYSPLFFFIGAFLVGATDRRKWETSYNFGSANAERRPNPIYQAGVGIMVVTLFLFIIPAPYFIWNLYAGKIWSSEPCFFGIEGYLPIERIEERLFGPLGEKDRRLRWSAWGSPLSRHREGIPQHERAVQYKYTDTDTDPDPSPNDLNQQSTPLLPKPPPPAPEIHDVSSLPTYPVETIDPTTPCSLCLPAFTGHNPNHPPTPHHCAAHPTVASLRGMSHSAMGALKVFTLVDTFAMTVTLFYAARPPTVLVVGGSEGGMKRAMACSLDVATGALCRETVLRLPSQSVDCMERLPRVRLGLRRPFLQGDVQVVDEVAAQGGESVVARMAGAVGRAGRWLVRGRRGRREEGGKGVMD